MAFIFSISCVGSNTFPVAGVICNWGSKALKVLAENSVNPLNIDNAHTSAAVATVIPQTEISDIILMALCDFLAKR